MEIGAGMNLAIIAKFIPATLGLLETFQLPNSFIKSPPPPPPTTHFHSTPFTLSLSRPCREPPPVPCVPALRLAQPSPISQSRRCCMPLPCPEPCRCLSTAVEPWSAAPLRTAIHCRRLPSALHFIEPCSAPAARLDHSHGSYPWRSSLQAQGPDQYP